MGFLVGLGKILIDFFLGRVLELAKKAYSDWQAKKAIEKAAHDSVQKLKDATTKEEIDAATDSALDKF